jgi:SCF-associated factor 1
MFSEAEAVREHQIFSQTEGIEDGAPLEPPKVMHITHISAHFKSFSAYSMGSSSIVLMGSESSHADTEPTIIPELQNKSVISVVLGDYHHGAVTSAGKLLTWGSYSHGALGLGDPVNLVVGTPGGFATERQRVAAMNGRMPTPLPVNIPTEVRFDHRDQGRKDRFCFAAAASGWHMGALVIDLNPDANDPDEDPASHNQDSSRRMPGHFPPLPPPHHPTHGPGEVPTLPIRWRGGIFRVGLAGNRGR